MKLFEAINATDKKQQILLFSKNRKKKNNKPNKSSSKLSFIDVFGGMTDYPSPDSAGSVNPDS